MSRGDALARLRQGKTGGSFFLCADRVLGVLSLPGVSGWSNRPGAVVARRRWRDHVASRRRAWRCAAAR